MKMGSTGKSKASRTMTRGFVFDGTMMCLACWVGGHT